MTLHKKSAAHWALAIAIGSVIESLIVLSIASNPPDPPLGLRDILLFISQFPGMFVGGFIARAMGISMTNTVTNVTLFLSQAPFYALLAYFLLNRWATGTRANNPNHKTSPY